MTRTACAVALGAALLLGACQQGQTERWVDPEPFPETRADLYRQYGPPDAIRREGDSRWLRYDHAEGKAGTIRRRIGSGSRSRRMTASLPWSRKSAPTGCAIGSGRSAADLRLFLI